MGDKHKTGETDQGVTMGGNNVILILTRQHQIDALHIQRQNGSVLLTRMLSLVRYIQPLANLIIMKHR